MARRKMPDRIFVGVNYAIDLCYICGIKLKDGEMGGGGKAFDVEFQEGACMSLYFSSRKKTKREYKRLLKAWRGYMEC